ncbi:MAG: hypothetical protein LAO24_19255 [Acidobacteriia bacterium]|nr:hypothetical protein [Terriglobia bacterium]
MKYESRIFAALLVAPLLLCLACTDGAPSAESSPKAKPEQDLAITFGGFVQNGPEDQLLDGQCQANLTRDVLQCDMHNGLMKWNITEIAFQVIRTGDREDERHYYRQRISIAPLQTETVTIKLGMQLPADTRVSIKGGTARTLTHWQWLVVGAKGQNVDAS